jgi:hypothetical protein
LPLITTIAWQAATTQTHQLTAKNEDFPKYAYEIVNLYKFKLLMYLLSLIEKQ